MESQAPPLTDHDASAEQQPADQPSWVRRFALPIELAIAFVALYVIAVCTPFGQAVEDSLLRGYSDEAWLNAMDHAFRPPPLEGEELTFFVGVALIALVAVRGRRWWLAAAGVFVPVATAAATFILNRYLLLRPNFLGEPGAVVETSFPSGHVAITAGVVAGAILISGPRARRYVTAVGVLWLAFIAAAVQNLGWHRASDAIGATLLACISYAVAVRLMPTATRPTAATRPLGLAPVLVIAAVGAILGGGRSGYVLEGIPLALIGVVCALLIWFTVARTTRIVGGIIVGTLVLALVSSAGIQYWRNHGPVNVVAGPEPTMITGPGTPGKGITYGQAGTKARIDIYFWFDDAGAARFEKANGETLDALLQDGSATVTYWPLNPNDALPKISGLFAVAAANGKGRGFLRTYFSDFAKTWNDAQLIQLGDKLGVPPGKFAADLTSNSYTTWLATITDESMKHQLVFSPSVLVNGKILDTDDVTPALLKSAIGR
ncbi:phosphatase PAP2 family protein [Kribbella antibiotica]|uniref:Phosphatase PAP2 family protein n=1 Tax=Kribbella antibiotica TaxID=190195 RepID=A0A4R5A098_9ACTN|nr:phosphatase PAP2 family protein [Kribbella antibiotica]TDD62892.1 phosphatase PAP2 family protein [Kribbella antibiotica]